jgi:RimJ/RimL family protein N-acetyltransferase
VTPVDVAALELRPLDVPLLTRLAAAAAWAEREGLAVGEHAALLQEIAGGTLRYMHASGAAVPWAGYLAIDPARRLVVGTCAFKGAPDADGMVEVAYFTFPSHEGRGYATAMARALRDQAATAAAVRLVRAHTLPERNASARILDKLGFRLIGEVVDPEDGVVWRWDWPVPAS